MSWKRNSLGRGVAGASLLAKKALFWEHRGGQIGYPLQFSPHLAMREGPWKLLMNPDRSRLELYDLQKHIMETDYLASEFPEVAQRMKASLEDWRKTPPEPDKYFEETKPSGWESLLSGGEMRKRKNHKADSDAPKKGEDTRAQRKKKGELKTYLPQLAALLLAPLGPLHCPVAGSKRTG
jgi:hypothetical protein